MQEAIEILESYFNAEGWPTDVSQEKLRARHRITVDEAVPECCIVEVERHRGALGATYIPGLPMSSYETYMMRYAVDLLKGTVRELPERIEGLSVSVYALVNEALSYEKFSPSIQIEENGYVVRESVSRKKMSVADLQDVKRFMDSFVDPILDFYSERFLLQGGVSAERLKVLNDAFQEALAEALLQRACDLWESAVASF